MVIPRAARNWFFGTSALILAAAGFGAGKRLRSGHARSGPPAAERLAMTMLPASPALADSSSSVTPETNPESVILAQRKRIMGRMRSLEMVRRVALEVRPLIDRAA